ncbi:MAG: hypothetical protein ACI9C1_003820 [Candidatus Aldehydirespiratoraceae bacterium]|jgi:hypothetical protein
MEVLAIVVGVMLVVSVRADLADLVNTLVAIMTNRRRFWRYGSCNRSSDSV